VGAISGNGSGLTNIINAIATNKVASAVAADTATSATTATFATSSGYATNSAYSSIASTGIVVWSVSTITQVVDLALHNWYAVTNTPTVNLVAVLSNYLAGGAAEFTFSATNSFTLTIDSGSATTNWITTILSTITNNAALAVKCRSTSPTTNLWLAGHQAP
jgi:hypothetical protein